MAGDGRYPETDPEQNEDEGGTDSRSAGSLADSAAAGEAGDRAGPGSTEAPSGGAFGGDRTRMDRDDDSRSGGDSSRDSDGTSPTFLVDSDYDDDFPGAPGAADDEISGQYSPDPGYAAFAGELDDPLADWPAPDTPLDSLPEMRGRGAADDVTPRLDPFADDSHSGQISGPAGEPDTVSVPPADDFPEAAFFGDPVEHDLADDYSGPAPGEADAAPYGVDRDEAVTLTADDPEFASGRGVDPGVGENDTDRSHAPAPQQSAPPVTKQPEPPDIEDSDEQAYRDFDDRAAGADIYADTADVNSDGAGADDSEAFVDDFLNDLDDPDDTDLPENRALPMRDALADADIGAELAAALPPLRSGARDEATADYRAAIDRAGDGEAGTRSMLGGAGDGGSGGTKDDAGLPWGMIAVVAVALLLLAAGGFGVVQQRSSLKAEIRDLQAQLATAVAPEEAAAEREQQRRIEVENESLAAEIAALEAENEALADQLSSLEAQLEQQLAAQERAARDSQAAAEASARQAQSTAREPTAPAGRAVDASGWFVNFGSYAQESIARRWADRLEVSEGRVVVQEARASGQTLYRVRVVGLPTRDAAERTASKLEREHQLPRLWVGRN
ncbi:MAG: SPOR domain-containing protein [Halieaceae bacterium]|jgi:cell division septation protein DedD|nr:SPOR domain-containing protein [Halieaceae bacterium]